MWYNTSMEKIPLELILEKALGVDFRKVNTKEEWEEIAKFIGSSPDVEKLLQAILDKIKKYSQSWIRIVLDKMV